MKNCEWGQGIFILSKIYLFLNLKKYYNDFCLLENNIELLFTQQGADAPPWRETSAPANIKKYNNDILAKT